jgi:hypothetical protein
MSKFGIVFFVLLSFSSILFAGDDDFFSNIEDPEIEEEGQEEDTAIADFFDKNVFGSVGYVETSNKGIDTDSSIAKLGVRYSYQKWSFLLEGISYTQDWTIRLRKTSNDPELEDEIIKKIKSSDTRISEFVIKRDIGDYLQLSIGRQRFVWGSMTVFSAIDLMQPTYKIFVDTKVSKLSKVLPVDAGVLKIFPNDYTEISFYHYFGITLPPSTKAILDNNVSYWEKTQDSSGNSHYNYVDIEYKKPEKPEQNAIKISFFLDSVIINLVAQNIYNTNVVRTNSRQVVRDLPANVSSYYVKHENTYLDKMTIRNLGFVFPLSKGAQIELELLSLKANRDLTGVWYGYSHSSFAKKYVEEMKLATNLRLSIPTEYRFLSIGYTKNADDYFFSVSFNFIKQNIDKKYYDLLKAEEEYLEASQEDPQSQGDASFFPTIAYQGQVFGSEKFKYNFGLGYLTDYIGMGNGITYTPIEGLSISFSQVTGLLLSNEGKNDDSSYKIESDPSGLSTTAVLSLSYDF